ncbi:putative ATPase [Humitalea rosea]|uniref:Putative ATPase n=1 Tax=Humitalea rosea TaxID=990373 RepID=A0A2W7I7S7_9PROT|nr:winged helix-turn-helix domain-containing protein [Humitalea rosea]PZW42991.1 putative ATPase [Humitalea rosea]
MQLTTYAEAPAARRLQFGAFELLPQQSILLEAGTPVRLGSRAFSILTLLVERAGEVVTHQEIRDHVWSGVFVDDVNLRVHIACLRKKLGEGQGGERYILNIPGQGYSFVAPVEDTSAAPLPGPVEPRAMAGLPVLLTRLVGRAADRAAAARLIAQHRLVTLVGPGGIGKTSLALAAAWQQVEAEPQDACFVDLAPLTDAALVPAALAAALGRRIPSEAPIPALVGLLRQRGPRRLLIVLDNCEHLIDACAVLAEAVLRAAPGIRIIATSREPLLAEGEWVHRLGGLALPEEADGLPAQTLLGCPAVQLFVERAVASLDSFTPDAEALRAIAAICRHLDGIPLAIELAASRVGMLSVQALAEQVRDRLGLLARGRRTALPRQQTLEASLDWSYRPLPEAERRVLRRLAIFPGGFTLAAAMAVVPGEAAERHGLVEQITRMAAKSLIAVDTAGEAVHYRLLRTTRSYAAERLREAGETAALARRHAAYLEMPVPDVAPAAEGAPWRDGLHRSRDDIRAALERAAPRRAMHGQAAA